MTDYQPIVPLTSLTPQKVTVVTIGEYKLALALIDGEPRAFQSLCPHDRASLAEGKVEGCEVHCPRHFARFNLNSGEVSAGWRVDNLKLYPVRIVEDMVEVDMDAVIATPPDGKKQVWNLT
ncbi:MAG: Rieske (2Fe-2S) protein [Methyloligellaceae bacterium]